MNAKKAEKKAAEPKPAGTWIQDLSGSAQVLTQEKQVKQPTEAPAPVIASQVTNGGAIMVKIGPMTIKLNRKDALVAARNILDQLAAQNF